MMAKVKILPYELPTITCYPPVAGLNTILCAYECTQDWILSNYVQLVGYVMDGTEELELVLWPGFNGEGFCPWINCSQLDRRLIKSLSNSITEFFVKCIDENNYIYTMVDEYFLSGTRSGKGKQHFPHDTFIFGYDLQEEVFHIGSFTFHNKYTFEKVPFSEMEAGYTSITDVTDNIYLGGGGVALWHYFDGAEYTFDPNYVKNQLIDYLNSTNNFIKIPARYNEKGKDFYGLSIYNALIEKNILPHTSSRTRNLHNLYEHKKLMLQRMEYMVEHSYLMKTVLAESYKVIVEKSEVLCNLSMKYGLRQDEKLLDRMVSMTEQIREEEKNILEEIIDNIIIR